MVLSVCRKNAQSMKRLLVVDDSKTVREVIKMSLIKYDVIEAADASIGLEKLRSGEFDCVITDINMPGMSGIDFIKAIKTEKLHKFKPIIALTDDTNARFEAKEAGAGAYLKKPFKADQIESMLKILIGT